MKRLLPILLLLLVAMTAFAQDEKKKEEFNSVREYRNKVFELHHRAPRDVYPSIALLGSGFQGAAISANNEMRTITVRDFPENIAAIEDALKRLDRAVPTAPDFELRISVLIASKNALPASSPVPDELAPVVRQLQSTLRFANYGLMTTSVHRTTTGAGLEGSGVADGTLLGITVKEERPIVYRYKLRDITSSTSNERPGVSIRNFEFAMNLPLTLGTGVQYQNVGFETPFTVRENEKVVIGTTTMGDKALIVVVTAGGMGAK